MISFTVEGQAYFTFLEENCTSEFFEKINVAVAEGYEILAVDQTEIFLECTNRKSFRTDVFMFDGNTLSYHTEYLSVCYDSLQAEKRIDFWDGNITSNYLHYHITSFAIERFKELGVI